MAQLKVKQISDFVAAVGTIHNATVGTAAVSAISTAKSEAIASANSYTNSEISTLDGVASGYASDALSDAKVYTDDREIIINAAFSDADVIVDRDAQGYASTAEANAIATASADATAKANAAEANAIATASADATSKANTAEANAIATASADATAKADAALSSAKVYADAGDSTLNGLIATERARIDALLLNSTDALDTFAEIEAFITSLDTTDISGLSAAISTGDANTLSSAKVYADTAEADALSAAKVYTDGREVIINAAFSDADVVIDGRARGYADAALSDAKVYADTAEADALSAAKVYADTAEADAIATASADATAKANAALSDAKVYADTAEADALSAAKVYADVIDADLQAQIDTLSGINSDEVIATFVSVTEFTTAVAFNINSHVAVFVNGLQIHERGEGSEGWVSADGRSFTVAGLGYDLEATDHIVVSGTLA